MKVISLNIRHGGGSRCGGIVAYLERKDADVVVLSEFRENQNAPRLRADLAERGYGHFAAASVKPRQNSVAIFAKEPFVPCTYPQLGEGNDFRLISGTFASLSVFGTYFPQQQAKSVLFDALISGIHAFVMRPACIIGDFNTGLHGLDEAGATFHCADQFAALTDCGLVDSWRTRNPSAREFSWYSGQGNGFRIDHIFCTPDADKRIRCVGYDQEPRLTGITDHAALVVEFSDPEGD